MSKSMKLFLLCILLLANSLASAQNSGTAGGANIDLTLFAGLGKHNGESQLTYGVDAAVLKNFSKCFLLGVGAGYLNNVDYGVEGSHSKSASYIPIFARMKFKKQLACQSNLVFECDGGCAVGKGPDTYMLISPKIGLDFQRGETGRSTAVKLMYNNIVNANCGVWGIAVCLSF